MKAHHAHRLIAGASGAVALCWSIAASAQQSVVVQNPQAPQSAPAPAPAQAQAPVVVTPPPAQSSPVVVSAAPSAPVEDHPAAVEADHGHDWRPNRALLMTGLIVGGVPYIASMTVAATSGHPGDSDLWVPVVGPWLDVGDRGGCPSGHSCAAEVGNKALLVGDGILQSVGVLEVVGSFIFPETTHVTTIQTSKAGGWVSFSPARMGAGGYGVSAVGQF